METELYAELGKVLNLPLGRISSFHNLPQNSGNFDFRDIHKLFMWCLTLCGV